MFVLWLSPLPVALAQNTQVDTMVDKLLRDANQRSQQQQAAPPAVTAGSGSLSNQIEAVRTKIRPCWFFSEDMRKNYVTVRIIVQMNRDGRPASSDVEDKARYQSDPNYRLFADNALRAVNNPRCQPWPLSPDRYESWRKITLAFDFANK
jgi:outer membrane biosynthesis protein TonB